MNKKYYVYILTNITNTVFYIGVTNDLSTRVYTHKEYLVEGFTKKYQITKLVYTEEYSNINEAIKREKQLKNWHREWKIDLIRSKNNRFDELSLN